MPRTKEFQEMYTSPLAVYEGQNLPDLPTGVTSDGKSLDNGARASEEHRSEAYQRFPAPIQPPERGNAFDFHGLSYSIRTSLRWETHGY
jgi:hypothetical protein